MPPNERSRLLDDRNGGENGQNGHKEGKSMNKAGLSQSRFIILVSIIFLLSKSTHGNGVNQKFATSIL